MVARSPATKEQRKMLIPPPLDPNLLRDTVKKVDKCMARLQELQNTVTGGGGSARLVSGVSRLSPRRTTTNSSTRASYLRTSLRCKQESSTKNKNGNSRRSPTGKLPTNKEEEWRRMSLPAMLLGETMGEIIQATQFARNIVAAAIPTPNATIRGSVDDPKTPLTKQNKVPHSAELNAPPPRKRENKQVVARSESSAQRAKSRITFKVSSPVVVQKKRENIMNHADDKENCSNSYRANRVSPRNRPWATKTVLFPNPLFHSTSPTRNHQKFCKTKSPAAVMAKPHKFLIKSPPVKLNRRPISVSPPKKSSPKLKRSFSPSRFANKFVSPLKSRNFNVDNNKKSSVVRQSSSLSTAAKFRRSFSPSRLANRFVSPLKSRTTKDGGIIHTHYPSYFSAQFSPPRI